MALGRYTEVFDFAPIGYAVLDAAGQIREINHAGAGLLGLERSRLIGKRRRILVIEDHSDAAASMETLLALEGHEVQTAANGAAGLVLARVFDPDIVLCDLGLPAMDGFEVARAIRADPALCDRRLIAVSGYAQPDDVARARSAGFDGHLAKPVTWASLQEVLASIDRDRLPG